jgi:hypothetical protein
MKIKPTLVSITVAATAVSAVLATRVLSWQDPNCANISGSSTDQLAPCSACARSSNGDWYYQGIRPSMSCTSTVWNASVAVDRYCGYYAYPVWIETQAGPEWVMANAIPTPLVAPFCDYGTCDGVQGANGPATNMIIQAGAPCSTLPPG